MRKALIASLALAAALLVAATASGRSTAPAAAAAIPGCAKDKLGLLDSTPTTLTIGADNPAYPPWFGGDEKTKPWKVSDPYSGKGYESAVAYAIAKQLGFTKEQVKWTVVPFNNSYRPGKKPFDVYLTQVSYNPARAKAADFSKSYYFVNQSLVGAEGHADRVGEVDRRAQELQARSPDRDDERRLHQERDQAQLEPNLRHERPGGAGAQEQADRRDRRGHADGVLRHRRPGPQRARSSGG